MTSRQIFNKAAEAGVSTAVLKIFHQIISFGATVLLVRTLSQEEFGIYSILYAVIPMLNIVGSFGLQEVLQRFLPEYYAKNEFKLARKLVFRVFVIRTIVSVFVILAIFMYWDILSELIKIQDYKNYFVIFCVCIIAYQQWGILTATVEAYFLHKFAFYIQIVVVTARASAYLVCFVNGFGLLEIVIIDTVVYLLLAAAFWVLYGRAVPREGGERGVFGSTDRRRIIRYALFNNFNSIGVRFMDNGTSYLIVAYFMSPTQVAIYAFCNQLANRFARISPVNYLASVVRPAFFSIGIASEHDRIIAMMRFLMKCIVWFYIPVFCFALLAGESFIALVFGKYQEYASLFAACIVVAAVGAIGFPVSMAAQLRERVDIILYSKVFGLLSLGASVLTVPQFGIWGAVCAVGGGHLLKNLFIAWFVRDLVPLTDIGWSWMRAIVYWGVVAVGVTLLPWAPGGLINLAVIVVVFLAAAIIFLFVCIDLDAFEKRFVRSVAEKARLERYLPRRMGG
jgi:O-antigen/teichoic acid export membrane protein